MSWTPEQIETLKRLWGEGLSALEIGRRLRISKNSVLGKVHRLNLAGRPSPIIPNKAPKPKPATKREAVKNIVRVDAIPAAPQPVHLSRWKKCLYTSGERGNYVLCDEMAEEGSLWCGQHRERCAVPGKSFRDQKGDSL